MNASASRWSRLDARVLYLSYDGMCDQLGASQVLPYLAGLAKRGHRITLVSFEKPERTAAERAAAARTCAESGIDWHPQPYHKHPPVLSSIYDVRRMRRFAARLHREAPFDLVHCRSYLPALVGLRMKRQLGVPFIFDMRGFWADERIDGGQWKLSNPLFRAVYRYFKAREADFLREADHVVSLTEAAKAILLARPDRRGEGPPISLIPCCVDFDAFAGVTEQRRAVARRALGIAESQTVATYLGSLGGWYRTDRMFDFFRAQLERDPSATFLFVTRDNPVPIVALAARHGIARGSLVIKSASREEVPGLVSAADYGLFFIKSVFSKKASCPTKLGEFLSMEIPVVTNGGVGDVAQIIDETGGGVLVESFDPRGYGEALDRLAALPATGSSWREGARGWFDLAMGVDRYDHIYRSLALYARQD